MKVTIDTSGFSYAQGVIAGMSKAAQDKDFIDAFLDVTYQTLNDRFGQIADAAALSNPKTLHHVYEWGQLGNPVGRLWTTVLHGRGQTKSATIIWQPSAKAVPVPDVAKTPGPSGKVVQEGVHIFYWKAPIMEMGMDVLVKPLEPGGTLAFVGSDGTLQFRNVSEGGGMQINPGGSATTGSFSKLYYGFWSNAKNIIDSELKPDIEARLAARGTKAVNNRRRLMRIATYRRGENIGFEELMNLGIDFKREALARKVAQNAV